MKKEKMELENTIKEAQKLLLYNKAEWEPRYKKYAHAFLKNADCIKNIRSKFREFPPLRYYISTTNAKNARNKLLLDVRYRGQIVAILEATQSNVTISTKSKVKENSLRDFTCDIELDNVDWKSAKAREFRRFFNNRENSRNNNQNKRNEEHSVESLLLSEFSKTSSKEKRMLGIQPVKMCGIRFGMPTPISASDHRKPLRYAEQYGGGIDIFARTGGGRHATYITVIEVKDENKPKEPPKDALKQAIQYAVFIRELLRSDCGEDWYKIFGFTGKIPQSLKIRVACAMPDNILDKSFANTTYPIDSDTIECHYIYFKYDGQQLSDFQTSLEK